MSLRAKLEAVIYAAEEPVTLAQLSTLFAAEALAERAAREESSADRAAGEGSGAERPFPDAIPRTAESVAEDYCHAPASDSAIEEAVEHPEQVSATQPDGFAGDAEGGETPAESGSETASTEDARRVARNREREAREEIRRLVDELIDEYDRGDRGMEIREIAGGYRVATKPEYHDAVRGFVRSLKPAMKLSLQALETLAVIAYKQPVTAPEVSEIRGVDSGGVLGSLISRKLVTTAGRKQVIGRPILYKTTKEFLLRFGLKDLSELPSMEEFEKMAGELVESEGTGDSGLPEGGSGAMVDQQEPQPRDEHQNERRDQHQDEHQDEHRDPHRDQQAHEQKDQAGEGETPVNTGENGSEPIESQERSPMEAPARSEGAEPTAAEEVQAAPELAEGLEDEELAAKARAAVQVDDEGAPNTDLPGVHRDTAGQVNIDSVPHKHKQHQEEL
jgi:segregation and condensation protein B